MAVITVSNSAQNGPGLVAQYACPGPQIDAKNLKTRTPLALADASARSVSLMLGVCTPGGGGGAADPYLQKKK